VSVVSVCADTVLKKRLIIASDKEVAFFISNDLLKEHLTESKMRPS
jgi:hypothetical protein